MRWQNDREYYAGGRRNPTLPVPAPEPFPASAIPAADDPLVTTIRQELDENKRRQFEVELADAVRRQRATDGLVVVEHGRPE